MKVSFVIPSYNCGTWLPTAIESCLSQSYKDCEIIVVNDGSTDCTSDYLKWLDDQKHKNIKIINNIKNEGRSFSRNIGNNAAQGDIILVLDADDINTIERASITVRKFKSSDCRYVYGSTVIIDSIGNKIGKMNAKIINSKDIFGEDMVTFIPHSTAGYYKSLALEYPYSGGEVCKLGIDDWEQQVRMFNDGVKFGLIEDVLCAYRMLDSSTMAKRNMDDVNAAKKEILKGLVAHV